MSWCYWLVRMSSGCGMLACKACSCEEHRQLTLAVLCKALLRDLSLRQPLSVQQGALLPKFSFPKHVLPARVKGARQRHSAGTTAK